MTEMAITKDLAFNVLCIVDKAPPSIFAMLAESRDFRVMEAKEKLMTRGVDKYPGRQTVWENMPPNIVYEAELTEISLVDKGAFPGTQFHIVGETAEQLNRRLTRAKK